MGKQSGSMEQGFRALSYLISGMVFYGGLGWLADWWLKTELWLPIGLIAGTGAGMYMVIKRYGRTT